MRDDLPGDPQRDVREIKRAVRGGRPSITLPAIIELVFGAITAIAGLIWFVALFLWVPEVVSSTVWIGGGVFVVILLAVPTAAIYKLRRGGIETLSTLIREVTG